MSQHFIHAMEARYPDVLHGHTLDSMNMLYQKIYEASCNWPSEAGTDQGTNTPNYVHSNSSDPDRPDYDIRFGFSFNRNRTNTSSLNEQWQTSAMVMKEESNVKKANTLWEDIAHGMHKASITILGILFVEVTMCWMLLFLFVIWCVYCSLFTTQGIFQVFVLIAIRGILLCWKCFFVLVSRLFKLFTLV